MKARKEVPLALKRLARTQGGLVTRAQAAEHLGVKPLRRLVGAGLWSRVTPSIYLTEPGGISDEDRLWAGYLLAGEGAALGGRAALSQWGLVPVPDEVQLWIPRGRLRVDRPGFRFRVDGLGRLEHTLGSLPRIRLEEALIDVGEGLALADWVALAAEAGRRDLVAFPEVITRIERRPRVSQRRMLVDVLRDLAGIESNLEFIYREIERGHGLPVGRRQFRSTGAWRCDVHLEFGLIIELDGTCHLKRVFRDLERDNAHAFHGEATLRYGSISLRGEPCHVAWQVGGAARLRGWNGMPRPCPRCPSEEIRAAWLAGT